MKKPATTASILAAMQSPALFGPQFAGPSWDRWRVWLATLFGLPMSADDMALFTQHTGRTTAPTQPFKEAALVIGRRGGKSRVLALIAVYLAADSNR